MKKIVGIMTVILGVAGLNLSCKSNTEEVVTPALTTEVKEALNAAILDEYKAQVTYQKILNDFGSTTRPFSNIILAEQKHASAIAKLLTNYKLPIPENPYTVDQMPVFMTVQAACAAGAEAEAENIEMYDQLLRLNIPADIRKVFENNRNASLNNHLPAFNACK